MKIIHTSDWHLGQNFYGYDRTQEQNHALRQIEDQGFARKFADDHRTIFKIGVRFSTETRCIDSWKMAE